MATTITTVFGYSGRSGCNGSRLAPRRPRRLRNRTGSRTDNGCPRGFLSCAQTISVGPHAPVSARISNHTHRRDFRVRMERTLETLAVCGCSGHSRSDPRDGRQQPMSETTPSQLRVIQGCVLGQRTSRSPADLDRELASGTARVVRSRGRRPRFYRVGRSRAPVRKTDGRRRRCNRAPPSGRG
jgi:hypothetical protein